MSAALLTGLLTRAVDGGLRRREPDRVLLRLAAGEGGGGKGDFAGAAAL